MIPDGMYRSEPPEPNLNKKGRQPSLLTTEKVRVLLANPDIWYVIGESDKWISGVKANIENMTQRNIVHLNGKGKFVISQRKDNDSNKINIYCKFVTTTEEE